METRSKVESVYAFAWDNGVLRMSHYPYYCAQSVTSVYPDQPNFNSVNPFTLTKTALEFTPGIYKSGLDYISGPSIALVGLVDLYSGGYPQGSYANEVQAVAAKAIQQVFGKASEPYFREIHQFGELAETISALKSPLKGIRTLSNKLSPVISGKNPGIPIKDACGAYLEHIYGTQPMFDQAATFGDLAARILDKSFPKRVVHRAYAKDVPEPTPKGGFTVYVGGLNRPIWDKYTLVYEWDYSVVSRAGAGIIVGNPRLRNSLNFAGTATEGWELLPLSFLANMFVDVAGLLKECRPVPGEILGSWVTTVCQTRATYRLISASSSLYGKEYKADGDYASVTVNRSIVERTVNISRTGKLHLGPGLDSLGKWLSTAALGVSLFGK